MMARTSGRPCEAVSSALNGRQGMRRAAFGFLVLAACGSSAYLPDGGRVLLGCVNTPTVIPVKAVDVNGNPVAFATVTARNTATGAVQTGTTNADGATTAITDALGPGYIDISAQSGAL